MKSILISCDTEIGELGHSVEKAFDIFINGEIGTQKFGVPLINKLASQVNAPVLHFVDVFTFEHF